MDRWWKQRLVGALIQSIKCHEEVNHSQPTKSQWQTTYTRQREKKLHPDWKAASESMNQLIISTLMCFSAEGHRARVCVLRRAAVPALERLRSKGHRFNREVSAAARVCLHRQLPGVCVCVCVHGANRGELLGEKKEQEWSVCVYPHEWTLN